MSVDSLGYPAVILTLLTAITLLVSRNWRWSIAALGGQYAGVFLLVGLQGHLEVALAKLLAGWIAAAVLALAISGTPEAAGDSDLQAKTATPSGSLFRLLAAGIVGLVASSLAAALPGWAPGIQLEQSWGAMLLIGFGLLQLGLTTRPLRIVLGLLTVLSGFEILYAAVETSALVTGLLAGVNLGLALVGGYLFLAPALEDV